MSKMPVIFSGHGDPMIALRDDEITRGMRNMGDMVIDHVGKPKAILAISGHWYVNSTYIQKTENPRQVYDMYGFPKELYEVKYPVKGDFSLSDRVTELLGNDITVNNDWGIDHGTWTVLKHMFPEADIPVVQLSVNRGLNPEQCYEMGAKLGKLREEGYLIFGSGNIVHNLRRVEWDNQGGSLETLKFNEYVIEKMKNRDDEAVIHYENIPHASYAVPTPEHYLPLLYILGAAKGEQVFVFNNYCNLGSMAMTGVAIGL